MISRRPIPGQSCGVIEGGAAYRESSVTGEALHRSERIREAQEETRGRPMRCEEADESVVVKKSRPMKAGNGVEDKTGTTGGEVRRGLHQPKALQVAKGGSLFECSWNF